MTTATPQQDIATTDPITPPPGAVDIDEWLDAGSDHAWRVFHFEERTTSGGHRVRASGVQYVDGSLAELGIHIDGPDCDDEVYLEHHDDVDQLVEHLRAAQAECRALRA